MPKVCFTDAEEQLLARGWPHQVRLVDGHAHDKNAAKSAASYVSAMDSKYYCDWPREVAYRAMRVGPVVQFAKTTSIAQKISKRTTTALAATGAPSHDEMKRAFTEDVASFDEHSYKFKVSEYVYLAETVLGTDDTLYAIAEGFENANTKLPKGQGTPAQTYFKTYVAGTIRFLLMRASEKARAKVVPRLKAQHDRFTEAAKEHDDWNWCAEHFDMSLNGAAAVKRIMTGAVNLGLMDYAQEDPDFVRTCIEKQPKHPMSVRVVAIVGVDAMKGMTKRKFPAPALAATLRDFGMIRAPETVELVLSLVGKSAVKDAPMQWLTAHAEYARPIVERAAKGGNASAKAALANLKT